MRRAQARAGRSAGGSLRRFGQDHGQDQEAWAEQLVKEARDPRPRGYQLVQWSTMAVHASGHGSRLKRRYGQGTRTRRCDRSSPSALGIAAVTQRTLSEGRVCTGNKLKSRTP